jgi:hypothetical protein
MFIHFLAIRIYLSVTQQWTISSGSIILAYYVTVLLMYTKFHDHQISHSSNIKVINSTISEAAVLVLLMGGIYEVCY